MAKPILFWALARSLYGGGFRIIGVTSEKGRQVYGRDSADAVTHVAEHDVVHRFPPGTPEDFAKAARQRADREAEKHAGAVDHAYRQYRAAQERRDAAILKAAKGLPDDR